MSFRSIEQAGTTTTGTNAMIASAVFRATASRSGSGTRASSLLGLQDRVDAAERLDEHIAQSLRAPHAERGSLGCLLMIEGLAAMASASAATAGDRRPRPARARS